MPGLHFQWEQMECINLDITAALDKKAADLRATVNVLPFTIFSVKVTNISWDLFQGKWTVQHFLQAWSFLF